MSRPFLFGNSSSGQSSNKYLVEFRAGKMTVKGKTVHPDKRKGTVYVHQTEDSLMHFCWKDRTSGLVEDELIIFPDDAEFKRVAQCTTGRVFVLKFKSSSRRCFYWMQEPKTDKDADWCSKVNEYLNNPPTPTSAGSAAGGGLASLQNDLSNLGDGDLQNLLNNMSQQQLLQLLGGADRMGAATSFLNSARSMQSSAAPTPQRVLPSRPPRSATASETPSTPTTVATPTPTVATETTPATTATTTTTGGEGASQIQLSDLQNILSGINVPPGGESVETAAAAPTGVAVDLSSAITAEALAPLLSNSALMERINALLPNPVVDSPVSSPTKSETNLGTTVQSPQFQQALSSFSVALQSGQLGPLMLQFGLGPQVVSAAQSGDMEAFVRALQNSQGDKKDDEEMALD